jgi:heme oxygenase
MQHKVPADSYKELLAGLFHIYTALEEELERCQHLDDRVKGMHFPALARKHALLEDLRYFCAEDNAGFVKALHTPSPAALQYASRIREIAKSQPLLLIAHSYTRYLGDLSGGQILAKAATKAFKLSGHKGISFYEFDEIPNATGFKYKYRATLDSLTLLETEADDLIHEANVAFIHNMRLFMERDVKAGYITSVQSVEEAMVMVNEAKSALAFQKRYADLGNDFKEPPASCPFLPRRRHNSDESTAASSTMTEIEADEASDASVCPLSPVMRSFEWLLQPEQKSIRLTLLGSLLVGSFTAVYYRSKS